MKFFPTRQTVWCAATLALASAFLLPSPGLLPGLAAAWALLAVLLAIDVIWLRRNAPAVSATLDVPSSGLRGTHVGTRVRLGNASRHKLLLRARLELPEQGDPGYYVCEAAVPSGGAYDAALPIHTGLRGLHRFGDIHLRVRGKLALMWAQRRAPFAAECKVYPDIKRVKDYLLARRFRTAQAPHLRTTRVRGIGSEFESLRDYEDGDDIRRIDWRATAKHDRLIARNYEIEHYRNVMVVLDCGRLMGGKVGDGTKLDCALDAALMVCGVALDNGDRCGVLAFDREVTAYLPPRGGMTQLPAILEAVYDARPTFDESNFRRAFMHLQRKLTKRSLVIVLSDVSDVDASGAVMAGLAGLSRRHLVVFAALRTPEVAAVLDEPNSSDDAPFRKAVAYRLVRDRAEVFARLQKGGIHVLDVAPSQLTMPLVNRYIELREANLL